MFIFSYIFYIYMETRWDLYRANMKHHKGERGIGMFTHRLKGYTLPTKEEMKEMSRLNLVYDIDPPIRSAVIELNHNRIKTEGSCAGHYKLDGTPDRGFISFGWDKSEFKKNKSKIIEILTKHNFKRLKVEGPRWSVIDKKKIWSPWYFVTFTRRT